MARKKVRCRYGKLKNPKGRRVCKLRRGATRASAKRRSQEAAMWKSYKPSLGRHKRRR